MAEMKRGGIDGSGLKVCWIAGRGWNVGSSGCCGGGRDAGTERSKRSNLAGEWEKEPIMRETLSGALPLGGRVEGGRAMFCTSETRIEFGIVHVR